MKKIFLMIFFLYGCSPDMPWNRGVVWGNHPERINVSIPLERGSIENFCDDNALDSATYRSYTNDESIPERQRVYIRQLLEQYDRECS